VQAVLEMERVMTKPSKYFPPQTPEAEPAVALRIECPVCCAAPGVSCTKYDRWQKTTRACRVHKRRREEEERTR
jgi:hypothetical protein